MGPASLADTGHMAHVPGVTLGIIDPVDLVPGIHGRSNEHNWAYMAARYVYRPSFL